MSEQIATTAAGRSATVADASTFAPAMRLLPDGLRQDVEALYGVLRSIDDLVDEGDPRAPERVRSLQDWACGGPARGPEAAALQGLAARHPNLRRDALAQFCEGMRHDLARRPIDAAYQFDVYCQQAGGSVGEVLASMLGAIREDPAGRRRAQAGIAVLGHAMQVTNILRDIDEDRAHGRLYIPTETIERLGYPWPGRRAQLLREGIARADALYEQGERAIGLLASGREAMALAASRYREILRRMEREELKGWTG